MRIFFRIAIALLVAAGVFIAQEMGVPQLSWEDIFPPEPVQMPEDSSFAVHFLDVGEGDASLVVCDGHAMLIDGGSSQQSSFIYSYLKSNGISHLDCIVATHPDADHVGGLSGALNYASVDLALCTDTSKDSKAFNSFVKYLDKQGKTITVPEAGYAFSLGNAEVTVLGPEKGVKYSDNTSLTIRVTYGNTSFLFMGDCEKEDEQHLMAADARLRSMVIKIGHHGSRSSSTEAFLKAVKPEYAVISVGSDNSYGHPAPEVLERLQSLGAEVYRTDLCGTILCFSDGNELTFESVKR